MKILKHLALYISVFLIAVACDEGIDPISPLDPGPDESAPQVSITAPGVNYQIMLPDAIAPVSIAFEATDDIELSTVVVSLNGDQIATFNEFPDYRRFVHEFVYDSISNGTHELTITATDLEGQSTSESRTFEKVPPYVPKYEGEIIYLPFENDFVDLISFTEATRVGSPGFAGLGIGTGDAYKGAADSYLTLPAEDLQSEEFSAVFWMNVVGTPERAGILVMSPPDAANPNAPNNRNSGFRFFREGSDANQTFKLNVGTGAGEVWFDGGAAASINPNETDWVHLAFVISADHGAVYINGEVVSEQDFEGIDWTGADLLSIMSGAPRFTGWDHLSDLSVMDELRLFNRALSQDEIQAIMEEESTQMPQFNGLYNEIFYVPFDGDFVDQATGQAGSVSGNPGFADGISGQAYAGAEDAFITFPADRLQNDAFSATFWMNVNGMPDRAGILIMSSEDAENPGYPETQNLRNQGFRFFREEAQDLQVFKLNVGTGDSDTWFDGGADAGVNPDQTEWVHIAFTISDNQGTVYIDGEIGSQGELTGMDWTGADLLSIMSGAPRFTEWEHFSDQSLIDELRIYDRELTQNEIQTMIADMEQ